MGGGEEEELGGRGRAFRLFSHTNVCSYYSTILSRMSLWMHV